MANSGSNESMKPLLQQKIQAMKQWSYEAFNAGKEIEAMKHLMLHRIASSLLLPSFGCNLRKFYKLEAFPHMA
jgi:hypothetical protein